MHTCSDSEECVLLQCDFIIAEADIQDYNPKYLCIIDKKTSYTAGKILSIDFVLSSSDDSESVKHLNYICTTYQLKPDNLHLDTVLHGCIGNL